jgi:hypothetical protein
MQVMKETGQAINDTFHKHVAFTAGVSGSCATGVVTLPVPAGAEFDYVVSAEDMRIGARFGNYSIEYQVSQNGYLLSRRGRSFTSESRGFDTHRASISSRFDCRRSAPAAGRRWYPHAPPLAAARPARTKWGPAIAPMGTTHGTHTSGTSELTRCGIRCVLFGGRFD